MFPFLDEKYPIIYIWKAANKNVGHAALSTKKYYISFWPHNGLAKNVHEPVTASLHLDLNYDIQREGKQPDESYPAFCATNEQVDKAYEDFLEFNGIDQTEVTMERGKDLFEKSKKDQKAKKAEKPLDDRPEQTK